MTACALELGSGDVAAKAVFNKIQWLGVVVVPVGWLVFCGCHTGRTFCAGRRYLALLSWLSRRHPDTGPDQ